MGGTYMDEVRVVGILAEGDSSVAQIFHVHGTGVEICTQVAPPELKKRFHEATVAKECRWSNAYSELGTKNIFEYSVKLAPDGDGFGLSGRKFYCTGSLGADVMYVTSAPRALISFDSSCSIPTPRVSPSRTTGTAWGRSERRAAARY